MKIEIRFCSTKYSWLCFKHAVKEAMAGEEIETDIDDFSGDYMGSTFCDKCSEELDAKNKELEEELNRILEKLPKMPGVLRPKESKPKKHTITIENMGEIEVLATCPKHKIAYPDPEINDCPMCHIEHEITNWRNSVQEMIMGMESRGLLNTEGVEKLSLVLKMINELLETNGKTN